jgi:flagellar basal body-associated protein FliL
VNAGFTKGRYPEQERAEKPMRSSAFFVSLFVVTGVVFATGARADDDDKQMAVHKVTQSESYIMLEPMYATIMDGDHPAGMLLVAIGLDIPDPKLRAIVNKALPVLRDDYVRSLISFAWTHVRLTEQPDVVEIADRLQRVTDRALHQTGARVLLAEVASRVTN